MTNIVGRVDAVIDSETTDVLRQIMGELELVNKLKMFELGLISREKIIKECSKEYFYDYIEGDD
ncbi:MAG: hypothetical protein BZ138_08045 [Methanosphaera sp. rholeuAM270]|nr:MAG: hypothetical protein BZ138_08045 [Methanosphaera sp. rholeuAM270]